MSNTEVAERAASPIAELRIQLENMEGQFKAALPAHIPVERFMRVVMTAIQNNPDLLKADRRSLWNAAMKAAQDGLLPDGREGAMVVRKNRDGSLSITWQPMIAGIRKKARNSGDIATWDAHVVCANDHFQFQLGDNPQINHSYDLRTERGPIVGAYSVCVLKDGTKSYEVMSIGEMHSIRDRSDAWKAFKAQRIKTTPWHSDEGEMCRKTVARRHSKVIPMSTDLDDLIRRDDELYDFNAPKIEAQAEGRQSLSGKLDVLAALPSSSSPSIAEQTDAETGEVIDSTAPQESGDAEAGAGTAGQADLQPAGSNPDKASPADTSTSSSQPTANQPAGTAAPGRAAPSPEPSQVKGDGAAKAKASNAGTATAPKNEAEYIAYANAWREALTDAGEGEKRWAAEKSLRNKAQVGADARETLQEKLAAKCTEIRDADRS